MSSLLSSLVQPVVRQARPFSAAPADAGDGAQATALSHVSDSDDPRDDSNAPGDSSHITALHAPPTAAALPVDPSLSSSSSFDQLRNRLPRPEFIERLRRLVTPSTPLSAPWSESENTAIAGDEPSPTIDASSRYPLHHSEQLEGEGLYHGEIIPQERLHLQPPFTLVDRPRSEDTRPVHLPHSSMTGPISTHSRRNTARLSGGVSDSNTSSWDASFTGQLTNAFQATSLPGALPENDGMADLRKKIVEIRDMAASSEEKAHRMHQLMTAEYVAHRQLMRPSSPASMMSAERPFTPSSPQSDMIVTPATSPPAPSAPVPVDPTNPFSIGETDLQPSYRLKADHHPADDGCEGDHAEEELELGCSHYKRNVKVQCFDCKQWFPCRHCHDTQTGHKLNRRKTENMLCMLCKTPQPAGQNCGECGMEAACYYCGICKLWDDDSSKRIYHCPDCGICRRGEGLGKDYVHCKRCNVCITISHHSSHRCIERATECDCPICGDYMFTSSLSVSALPCGHYMHKTCYQQYMAVSYKCPICQRSAVNMELQWRKLDNAIESQPMPTQFRDTKAEIQCNDCGAKGMSKYHWLGNKCSNCDSYNTSEIRLLGSTEAEDARRRLLRRQTAAISAHASQPHLHPLSRRTGLRTIDERSTRSATQLRSVSGDARSPISYFLNEQPEEGNRRGSFSTLAALPSAGILMSPVELLQRVSRSLSPMRHYLEFGTEHDEGATDDDDGMGFWGGDARSGSGGEDEYSEDDDSEEDESADEEAETEDEDDGEDGEERWEGIDLPGHR